MSEEYKSTDLVKVVGRRFSSGLSEVCEEIKDDLIEVSPLFIPRGVDRVIAGTALIGMISILLIVYLIYPALYPFFAAEMELPSMLVMLAYFPMFFRTCFHHALEIVASPKEGEASGKVHKTSLFAIGVFALAAVFSQDLLMAGLTKNEIMLAAFSFVAFNMVCQLMVGAGFSPRKALSEYKQSLVQDAVEYRKLNYQQPDLELLPEEDVDDR